jgi:hypothetical protein
MFVETISDGRRFPERYFYFNNCYSELRVNSETLQSKNISITKGYTIIMWIRAENVNQDSSNKKISESSTIYYINTSKSISFEVYLKNKSLYYRLKTTINEETQEDTNHLVNIEYSKWTMLVFTHKPSSFLHKSEFTVYKDGEVFTRMIEYPNVKNQKMFSIGFFKEFTGQVSNLIMANESLINFSFLNDLKNFSFGIYNESNIRTFKKMAEERVDIKAFFDIVIFIYSPSRVKNSSIVKDLIDNINGEIVTTGEGNVLLGGCAFDNNYHKNVEFLGGVNILLPIFEFLSKVQFVGANILEEALSIIIRIIDGRELNQVKKINLERF